MRKMKSKFLVGFLSLLIATLVVWVERAQSQEAYPTKPIEIIVPYGIGGVTDLYSRTVATFVSKKWGVPVNVVNKPGGNGIPGILALYNAIPDGYTMLGDSNSSSSMIEVAVKDLPFKVMDRTFVGMVGATAHVFLVAANSPFKSMKDVAAAAKRDPGNFVWAIDGTGTGSSGTASRQFFKGIDVAIQTTKPISVAGGAGGVIMVAGGQAICGFTTLTAAVSSLKGGTVRALAITSKDRHPDWPDVPTTAEVGYPDVNSLWWGAISGPPKLPAFIVAKWEKAIEEILRDPEVIAVMKNIGLLPVYLDSKATRELVIKEIDGINKLWGLTR